MCVCVCVCERERESVCALPIPTHPLTHISHHHLPPPIPLTPPLPLPLSPTLRMSWDAQELTVPNPLTLPPRDTHYFPL